MTKEFIPHEEALALKELGFNEECFGYYIETKEWMPASYSKQETVYPSNKDLLPDWVTAPLYQQAFRWFREKYELYQAVYADKRADDLTLLYKVHVYKLDEELSEYAYRWAKTYEEAELACLKQLIKIVKEKNND